MCRKKGIHAAGRNGGEARRRLLWPAAITLLALGGCDPAPTPPSASPASFLSILRRSTFLPREALLDLRQPPTSAGRRVHSAASRLLPGRGWSFAEPTGTWSQTIARPLRRLVQIVR